MKNLSAALIIVTTLSVNLAPARAVNKQVEIDVNNELHSQGNKITDSDSQYRTFCYWIGIPLCK